LAFATTEDVIILLYQLSFTVASFLCGNATNIWELVAFRFVQGLGGGALLVTAQTILQRVSYCKTRNGTGYLRNGSVL
jgi:MFS family permease